jgi:hypothetical protein
MADPNNPGENIGRLLNMHDAIHDIYRRAEDALDEEIRRIDRRQMRRQDAREVDDYSEHMRQSIRQAVLIMLYSYLEAGMDLIGNLFVRDYTKEIGKKKKGEGSLKTRLRVFEYSGIGFAPAGDEGDIAEALRLIRNCLVHAGGLVAKSTEREKLQRGIQCLQERCQKSNCRSIEIRAGQIFLHSDVIALANCTSFNLLGDLYEAAMRRGNSGDASLLSVPN